MSDQRFFINFSLALWGIFTAILLYITNLSLSIDRDLIAILIYGVAGILCGHLYRTGRNQWLNSFVIIISCLSYFSLASLISSIASYPLAAISHGWWDNQFIAADAVIGLDWLSYWNFVIGHPNILYIYSWAYGGLGIMPPIILVLLACSGKADHSYRFVTAFIIALAITIICMALFPARSAAASFLPANSALVPQPGLQHIPLIEGLRNGSVKLIIVGEMKGLIALPSFHGAASLIFAWAGWQARMARVPLLIANGLMLISTPINGGHYFVDVLAGLGVAAFSILVSHALSFRPKADPLPSSHLAPAL